MTPEEMKAAVLAQSVYLDRWARGARLEVERVAPLPGGDGAPRVWFKPSEAHPDPVDWPIDQVLDGSRFVPAPP